jgi:exopolysaccharide biosynthesis polyprenyl glycosylphosphotransferase
MHENFWRYTMIENQRYAIGLLKLLDVLLVVITFGLTTVLIVHEQGQMPLHEFLSVRIRLANFFIFGFCLLVNHVIFSACSLYRSRRLSRRSAELVDVLKAVSLSSLCFLAIGFLFSVKMITPLFVVTWWVVAAAVLVVSRISLRSLLSQIRRRGRNLRYMLILGTNKRAIEFARKISRHQELGYRVVGFVDDESEVPEEFRSQGGRLVCNYAGLPEFLRRNVIDEVANFLPVASRHKDFSEVADLCSQHGIIMRFDPDSFGLQRSGWQMEEFDGEYYIAACGGLMESWPLVVKRIVDIVLSFSLLVIASPIMLGAALAIKLTSPGPVFFRQERIGLNKRRFVIYKFRTMVPNAEQLMAQLLSQNEASGPVFKIRHDPRITRVGRFLRRSSIDELPQLLNVLKGDMSLVGPRPLPVRDYEGFDEDWQRRRFSVKPGITCLWQVNGRSNISFDRWMKLDLQYMDEWSLWLDMKILVKTIPAVMKGSGAA